MPPTAGYLTRGLGGQMRARTLVAGNGFAITNTTGAGDPNFSIDTAIVPTKAGANTFAADQTFSAGINANGGYIRFPATQVPSSGANDLDDYEEGNWTPVLNFAGGTTGITYSTQTGKYVKIGKWVHAAGRIDLTSKGSSTGGAIIDGNPFTEGDAMATGGIFNYYSNMAAAVIAPSIYLSGTQNYLAYSVAGTVTGLDNTHFNNNTVIIWTVSYRASA